MVNVTVDVVPGLYTVVMVAGIVSLMPVERI
jgi:hypothetical protein